MLYLGPITAGCKPVRSVVRSIAIVVGLVLLLRFNRDAERTFADFARDRQAVVAYIDHLSTVGPLVLMGLIGLQVLIPLLPAEPPMIILLSLVGANGLKITPAMIVGLLMLMARKGVVLSS